MGIEGKLIAEGGLARLLDLVDEIALRRGINQAAAIAHLERIARAEPASLHIFAERWRQVRARRNQRIGALLFRDPAWDMLLDLFIAEGEGRPVSVFALCCASGVPHTTALRHLDRLAKAGCVQRDKDDVDHRRVLVTMGDDAREAVASVLLDLRDAR